MILQQVRKIGYGGRPLCKALKVKVASLNPIRHWIGSQWSWLKRSLEYSGNERLPVQSNPSRCIGLLNTWRRAVCLSGVLYRVDQGATDATEAAMQPCCHLAMAEFAWRNEYDRSRSALTWGINPGHGAVGIESGANWSWLYMTNQWLHQLH